MSGFDVTIKHRFGSHNGPTEWEIGVDCARYTDDLAADIRTLIHSLPPGVDPGAHDGGGAWLHLPEGTTARQAGEIAALLAELDGEGLRAACVRLVESTGWGR